jgi:hypothetical protein
MYLHSELPTQRKVDPSVVEDLPVAAVDVVECLD